MKQLEETILMSFKKKMGEDVLGLELIVCIDLEAWEEEHLCDVMETKDNGKVWTCICTRTGKVKEVFQV